MLIEIMTKAANSNYYTAEQMAKLLGLSVRRVQQLRSEGAMVTEVPEGETSPRYNVVRSLLAYCKHLQSKADTTNANTRIKAAEADKKEKQAALLDIELRKRNGEVHEARHVATLIDGMIVEAKGAFLGVPGRIAVDLANCDNPAETAQIVRRAICDAMSDLAGRKYDPDRFRRLVEEDGDINADFAEDDD